MSDLGDARAPWGFGATDHLDLNLVAGLHLRCEEQSLERCLR